MLWQLAKSCEMWVHNEEQIRDSLVIGIVDKELSLRSRVQSDSRGSYSYIAHHTQFISKQNTDPGHC